MLSPQVSIRSAHQFPSLATETTTANDGIRLRYGFPFDWEGYTPYNLLPPLPKLKKHTEISFTPDQLNRVVGRYALPPDVVLSVTVENGRLFIQENDEPKQELLPENSEDFYSANSSDEYSFKPADANPARVLVLHLGGKDIELKRLP